MADPITTVTSVQSIVITYDDAGGPTGLQVRYLRTFSDSITFQQWSLPQGPFELDISGHINLLNRLRTAMPPDMG